MSVKKIIKFVVIFLISCNFRGNSNFKEIRQNSKKANMTAFTKDEILTDLDNSWKESPYKFFPDLEDGYFFTAGNRISIYADEKRWAIVIEKTGYAYKAKACQIELTYFGNCLRNLRREGLNGTLICNTNWITLIDSKEFKKNEEGFELFNPDAKKIMVRDYYINIEKDTNLYKARGITLEEYKNPNKLIDFVALVRYLDETNVNLFRANNEELRTSLPADLPLLLQIDNWHYKPYGPIYDDIGKSTKPSSYETFQMIAEILITRDIKKWTPTLPPNNNWRNYPLAGSL